jgi:hypothetical protein
MFWVMPSSLCFSAASKSSKRRVLDGLGKSLKKEEPDEDTKNEEKGLDPRPIDQISCLVRPQSHWKNPEYVDYRGKNYSTIKPERTSEQLKQR